MGRNKDLRKKIAGYEAVIAEHEAKIRKELVRDQPDEGSIAGWKREIQVLRESVSRLTRRLKREW